MVDPKAQIKKEHRHTAELLAGPLGAPRPLRRTSPLEMDEASTEPLPSDRPLPAIHPPEPDTVTRLIKFLKKPE